MSESNPSVILKDRLTLKYLYGGVVHYRPGDGVPSRVLPDFELVMIIEGRVSYRREGQNYKAEPGSIILARPGFEESYVWDLQFPTRHAYIHFDITSLPEDWPAAEDWPILQAHPDPVVAPMFRHLIEKVALHPEWPVTGPDSATCRFLECLLRIVIRPQEKRPSPQAQHLPDPVHHALGRMRTLIERSPGQPITLAELARSAGVTEKHLCRLFRTTLGQPPMKTFRLLKLQLALALLNRSNLSIKEVADRCGFENPLYFSRCFRQTYHASPRRVRQSLRDHQAPPSNPLPPEITPRIFW